jgi:hypothetical protein
VPGLAEHFVYLNDDMFLGRPVTRSLFFTPNGIPRYFLENTVGNLVERTLTFGALVQGGVMDRFPNLKICNLFSRISISMMDTR